jgi:hypothetical protein
MSKNPPSPSDIEAEYEEYKLIEATSFETLRDTDSDHHIVIASKCENEKLIVVARIHIKDAQHILTKILSWDKSIQ